MITDPLLLNLINDYVLEQFPNEAVIGVKDDTLHFFDNIHTNPTQQFEIDPIAFQKVSPTLLLHSHTVQKGEKCIGPDRVPYDPRTPSYADMVTQKLLNIPFGIVSTSGEDVSDPVYFPDYEQQVKGNDYISGVNDCLSVVQRHYWQEYGITIPDFPREVGFFYQDGKHKPPHSVNLYEENYKAVGFYEVPLKDIQRSDLVLMAILSDVATHGAIYLGDGKIVHHLTNRLSGEEILSKWHSKITKVLRYEKG